MYLEKLSLNNFKNYKQVQFAFSDKLNCFVGNNGVGKTNLLDAVYYLSITKSYFNSIDSQNIRHGSQYFIIKGTFPTDEGKEEVFICSVQKNKNKKFSRNKKNYKRLADHIGFIPVVMVSPADLALVNEGSEERRKFIDAVISQYDRSYLEDLINYNKALKQRNILLKNFFKEGKFSESSLELWDQQMIGPATRIHQKRVDFVEQLIPGFQKYYGLISEGKEVVSLEYRSQLYSKSMIDLLEANREKDRILQYTSGGIHKDDLELKLDEYPIKKVGSQGQLKTYLVSLKLAKFDFIKERTGRTPIFLMDDIFDKFDAGRVKQIIKIISDPAYGQIFITDTHQTRLEDMLENQKVNYKVFKINDEISEINSKDSTKK